MRRISAKTISRDYINRFNSYGNVFYRKQLEQWRELGAPTGASNHYFTLVHCWRNDFTCINERAYIGAWQYHVKKTLGHLEQ
jgi:hypothetical protein